MAKAIQQRILIYTQRLSAVTSPEIIARGKALFTGFQGEFIEIKKQGYAEFIDKYQTSLARVNQGTPLQIDTADPYNWIVTWYSNLQGQAQEDAKDEVKRFKVRVQRYKAVWE